MSDIVYWALITALGLGAGWFVGKFNGVLFMAIVCGIGGLFLWIENKLHPHLAKDK